MIDDVLCGYVLAGDVGFKTRMSLTKYELPETFPLDRQGRLHIGCVECAFAMVVNHRCDAECGTHETVDRPKPLKILPHAEHPAAE